MMMPRIRGSGRTTEQMLAAPEGAVFIYESGDLWYPKRLAQRYGREDLEIVRPEWLLRGKWRGRTLTGLVCDHALLMNEEMWSLLCAVRAQVRR